MLWEVEFLPPVQVARRTKRCVAWIRGASAATRRRTGEGTRSRISVEERGSKEEEREVVGVRALLVTMGGGDEAFSCLTGVVAVLDILIHHSLAG